ncbi:hypothetical protein BC941DRAFT_434164 [Chlamydoabsidia padenii]|nr:hypothetical protein BC941DRAFT_434164 [Chlamydoabsidia padenii]
MTTNMNFGPEWMRGGSTQRSSTADSTSTPSTLSPVLDPTLSFNKDPDTGFTTQNDIYKYSKDFMLSLYQPSDAPQQFERLPYVVADESVRPLAFVDLTDHEKTLLSGPVHAESTRRTMSTNEKDANGGRRYHRGGTDYLSSENDTSRLTNQTKGRHGTGTRRNVTSDLERSGYGNSQININDSKRDTTWGSWESGNNSGDTDDYRKTAPLSWSGGSSNDGRLLNAGDGALGRPTPSTSKLPSQYKWFYRDPSGNVQGPFGAQEMHDWHKAGFFGPTLWLRREDQEQFTQLAAFVLKVGNEDIFMNHIPTKNDITDALGGMSSFRPMSDPFGRISGPGPLYGGGVSSPGLVSPGGFFGNNQAAGIVSSGIGKYGQFGNPLHQGPDTNLGTPSSPLTNPIGNSVSNVFSISLLGRESGSARGDRPAWLNNSQSDLFGNTFQRQHDQPQPLHYQPQNPQQYIQPMMMNPLFQQFDGDTMDSQQQFAHLFQQRQQAMANQPFHPQQDTSSSTRQSNEQYNLGQNQVSNSPVIRPAMALHNNNNGWGSAPGTPLATESNSSPWGSLVSPAIPQKVSEELQAKAPGQQSPRTQLSPQLGTSTAPTITPSSPVIHTDTATLVWEQPENSSVDTINKSLNKISLHAIQQEQEQQHQEILRKQVEKEEANRRQAEKEAANLAQKKLEAQQNISTTTLTKAIPAIPPQIQMAKPVSLRDIQTEELEKQQQVKKQIKMISKITTVASQPSATPIKSGWATTGSAWANESSHKGPSLREIQDMEAKEAELKKEMDKRAFDLQLYREQQQQHTLSTVTPANTSPRGSAEPWKATSTLTSTTTTSSAWGSATAPKKTLREIQQEEEAAMQKKALKQQQQQQQQQTLVNKMVFSTMASVPADDDDSWTTVQPKPKPPSIISAPITRTNSNNSNNWGDMVGATKKPATVNQVPPPTSRPMVITPQRKINDAKGPSEPFKMWCKQSLRDLSPGVDADEILNMFLSFPADNSVGEIIQDIIYANSTSMDGRRFAAEFIKRRRADLTTTTKTLSTLTTSSIQDTKPTDSFDDESFQVVNKKGKKVKST